MTDGPGIDGVSKRYGEVVALRDMTFDVREGSSRVCREQRRRQDDGNAGNPARADAGRGRGPVGRPAVPQARPDVCARTLCLGRPTFLASTPCPSGQAPWAR